MERSAERSKERVSQKKALSAELQIDRPRFAHNALATSLQKDNKISANLQIHYLKPPKYCVIYLHIRRQLTSLIRRKMYSCWPTVSQKRTYKEVIKRLTYHLIMTVF